eukprot:COSAG06_NODE_66208_length_255_cov_0.564103_1_plen_21_part_10
MLAIEQYNPELCADKDERRRT